MQPTYPKGLASSQDASQLSLTVSSATQLVLWLVGMVAVSHGFNPLTAQNAAQAYIDVAVNAAPAIMVIYHAVMTFWGLIRKGLSYFKNQSQTLTPAQLEAVAKSAGSAIVAQLKVSGESGSASATANQ